MNKAYLFIALNFLTIPLLAMEPRDSADSDRTISTESDDDHNWAQQIPDEWMEESTEPQQSNKEERVTALPQFLQNDLDQDNGYENSNESLGEILQRKWPKKDNESELYTIAREMHEEQVNYLNIAAPTIAKTTFPCRNDKHSECTFSYIVLGDSGQKINESPISQPINKAALIKRYLMEQLAITQDVQSSDKTNKHKRTEFGKDEETENSSPTPNSPNQNDAANNMDVDQDPSIVEELINATLLRTRIPGGNAMHYWACFFRQLDGSQEAIDSLKQEFINHPQEMYAALTQPDEDGNLPIHHATYAVRIIEHEYVFNHADAVLCFNALSLYNKCIETLLSTPELRKTLEHKNKAGLTPIAIAKRFYDEWLKPRFSGNQENPCCQPMLIFNKDNTLSNIRLMNPPYKKSLRMPWLYQYYTTVWPKKWQPIEEPKKEEISTTRSQAFKEIYKIMTGKDWQAPTTMENTNA